ncbi:hypothetical protein LCGC14_1000240 [marine sediment metagenome]|uniref:Uncharacterized protein n=1 Tax=marine sediment metagenome TaxID=412755 RepID=A0A0F9R9C4_9ZZZZ
MIDRKTELEVNMKRYEFTITIADENISVEEAWAGACEAFALDPGCPPEVYEVEDVDD